MSSGARETLSVIREPIVGTAVKTAMQNLRFNTCDLDFKAQLDESDEKHTSRLSRGSTLLGVDVEGGIEAELSYGTFDKLIEAAFCGTWTGDVLTSGDKVYSHTVVRGFEDVKEYAVFSGVHVNEMNWSFDTRSKAMISFGLMGMDYERVITSDPRTSPVAVTTTPHMSSRNIGKIKVGGDELSGLACVTSFTFNINNGAVPEDCLGDERLGAGSIDFMDQAVTGTIVIEWGTKAADIIANTLTRGKMTLELPIEDNLGNKYVLDLAEIEVNGGLPTGGRTDKLKATVEYSVTRENFKLTKTDAI